jgi:hypothetical protein
MNTPLRILLADDQVPWDTDEKNNRTKAEIRREFAVEKPDVDVDVAFQNDFAWFSGLLVYLEQTKGETIIRARTFNEASQRLDNSRDLDVAIVDMSWWGDPNLDPGVSARHNIGHKLLPEAADATRSKTPIIALSQNFSNDFELMSTVLERGALPIPKPDTRNLTSHAKELSYRTLYAAVRYLSLANSCSRGNWRLI